MTVQEWRRVKRLFNRACRLSGTKRSDCLDRVCACAPAIRQEVEELLAQHERSTAFFGVLTSGADQKLAHYRIQKRLGEGGMGLVYKAEDTRLNRPVAIKALPPWLAQNAAARNRCLQEARAAARLNHPSIITIYEVLHTEAGDFIVMEYLSGQTLKDAIPPRGLPVHVALAYVKQIADALDYAHSNGILHRDLKPSNIFVGENGGVKLLDFGLAIPFTPGKSTTEITKDFWGTSAYMAPEQRQGVANDPRSEVFSFGIVFWEMLTGRHPFPPHIRNDRDSSQPLAKRRPAKIPPTFEPFLRRCLEQEAEKRFPTMREVNAALKDICNSNPSSVGRVAGQEAQPDRSLEFQKARAAIGRMNYASFAESRRAAEELRALLQTGTSDAVRTAVRSAMRDLILSTPQPRSAAVSPAIREIRKLALELLRLACNDDLRLSFSSDDLKYLDLWNMNFDRLNLSSLSFEGCFLVEASFAGCDLTRTTFTGAWIRNVNFAAADLSGVDFRGVDWFNALGLTDNQLRSVRPETLMKCPANEARLREYLDDRYGFPIGSWSDQVREQLFTAWTEYLCPGGLREFVDHLHRRAAQH